MVSQPSKPGGNDSDAEKREEDSKGGEGEDENTKEVGSWIVSRDDKGYPYWTNSVTGVSTYRLFLQQDGRGTPIKHVEDHTARHLYLPLAPPDKSKANKKKKKKKRRKGFDVSDDDDEKEDTDDKAADGEGGEGAGAKGSWEELFDAFDGTKMWYHSGTKKTTFDDPFW